MSWFTMAQYKLSLQNPETIAGHMICSPLDLCERVSKWEVGRKGGRDRKDEWIEGDRE